MLIDYIDYTNYYHLFIDLFLTRNFYLI